jgi:hypothetical protein
MELGSLLFTEKTPRWVIWAAAILSLIVGLFVRPLIDSYISTNEAQANRIAQMRLEDYRSIAEETQNFNVMLQSFTRDIQQNKPVGDDRREAMVSSLIRQYDSLTQFRVYVDDPSLRKPVSEYQTSLISLRSKILETKSSKDLNDFYLSLADALEKRRLVIPVLEKTVGKSS